jgi:hypothetical protein
MNPIAQSMNAGFWGSFSQRKNQKNLNLLPQLRDYQPFTAFT